MIESTVDILFFLDKLGLIRGYGLSRSNKPYRGAEDLMWDIVQSECSVGEILQSILENKDVNEKSKKIY